MRSSTARQYEIFDSDLKTAGSSVDPQTSAVNIGPDPFYFPPLGANAETYAHTARIAARINAGSVSEKERNALLRERQELLDKHFAETLSRGESIRLEYIRWSLDRIEDAKHGLVLDVLDTYVSRYEQFLSDIRVLQSQLQRGSKSSK